MGTRELDKNRLARRRATEGPLGAWNGSGERARGNLVPGGASTKVAGQERHELSGPARCAARDAVRRRDGDQGRHREDETLVIRIEGPSGGSGMEVMRATLPVHGGQGMGDEAAHVAGSRSSGVPCGSRIGHFGPEAAEWRPVGTEVGAPGSEAGWDVSKMRRKDWRTSGTGPSSGGEWTLARTAGQACTGGVAHP